MPGLAVATVLPIVSSFIVCVAAFVGWISLMIRSQRRAEDRASPLANEFWHYRDHVITGDEHDHRRRPSHAAHWSMPTIHFVTYDRGDASLYALPEEYEVVGATR
jgi:hypothetical protein